MSKNKMDMLTKDELKKFSEKLSDNGRNRLSIKKTAEIVNRFIKPPSDLDTKSSDTFSNLKITFLKTCLITSNPSERWEKCKILLNEFVDKHSKPINSDNKMNNNPIKECIKTVVFFNAQEINHPEGVVFIPYSENFPDYSLDRTTGITLSLYSKDKGVIGEKYLNDIKLDQLSKEYISNYSILIDKETGKHHGIEPKNFYNDFVEKYPEIVKSYNLKENIKPEVILNTLNPEVKVKFLQYVTNSQSKKYQWGKSNFAYWNFQNIVKDFFPEIKDDVQIEGIDFQYLGFKPYELLINEEKLWFNLIDSYINKLSLYDKKNYLLALQNYIKGFSLFELESFRNLVREWMERGNEEQILGFLIKIKSEYFIEFKDPQQTKKWTEYITIYKFIEGGCRKMEAYKIVSPGDDPKTVAKRIERCKKELQKQGIDSSNPNHIEVIHQKYNIPKISGILY